MADWSKPSLGDQYANFLKYLNLKLADVATQFSTASPTNAIDQSIRWNPTNAQWEQYSASANTWAQLCVGGVKFPSILLAADPQQPLQAATKQYVDSLKSLITAASTLASAALPKVGGTLTGNLLLNNTTAGITGVLGISAAAGASKSVNLYTAGSARWALLANGTAEAGGNVGTDFELRRYTDAGILIDTPMTIARSTGVVQFSQAPTWGSSHATPWDSSNLSNPYTSNGGPVNGDLTLTQAISTTGDTARLVFANNTNGLRSWLRLNSTTGALEIINNAYTAINFSFQDAGGFTARGNVTGANLLTSGIVQFTQPNGVIYDYISHPRYQVVTNDATNHWGGYSTGNYTDVFIRQLDGAQIAIMHGNGDFYSAAIGWVSSAVAGKAPAGVFHHNATIGNCWSNQQLHLSTSGNTMVMQVVNTPLNGIGNCNCTNCG
jgi:hypothetical protein